MTAARLQADVEETPMTERFDEKDLGRMGRDDLLAALRIERELTMMLERKLALLDGERGEQAARDELQRQYTILRGHGFNVLAAARTRKLFPVDSELQEAIDALGLFLNRSKP